jgi:prepilin-type N-terminal cleavage/methylation domain-containing protein
MKKPQKEKKDAFTLVEMLIVVGVIAILAAIAIPTLGSLKQDGIEKKKQMALVRVAEAKAQYYQENRTQNPFLAPHDPASLNPTNTLPKAADLLRYLNINPNVGTNAFYTDKPKSLCEGCFNTPHYLNPNGPDTFPSFEPYTRP